MYRKRGGKKEAQVEKETWSGKWALGFLDGLDWVGAICNLLVDDEGTKSFKKKWVKIRIGKQERSTSKIR